MVTWHPPNEIRNEWFGLCKGQWDPARKPLIFHPQPNSPAVRSEENIAQVSLLLVRGGSVGKLTGGEEGGRSEEGNACLTKGMHSLHEQPSHVFPPSKNPAGPHGTC